MIPFKTAVLIVGLLCAQGAHTQEELMPEPGALAELDRYDLKLREAFSEAYERGVDLRAIFLPSFSPEVALFVEDKNIITLSPKDTSIWNHEHRELVRQGVIKRSDAEGREIPPDEEDEDDKKIPEKIADIEMERKSRPIPETILKAVHEVWEDALIHATHAQEPHFGLDGASWHYSLWVRGRGVLSGTTWSPKEGTIPNALNKVLHTLMEFTSRSATDSEVMKAVDEYKAAAKKRSNKPALDNP